jgi:hypothetical protein
MAKPQTAIVNWWIEELRSGRRKVGDTFECRSNGAMPVTPEQLGCSTPGSIYNLMQLMVRAGLFTRAGDGYLAVGELWEAVSTPEEALQVMKQVRPVYKAVKGNGEVTEHEPEPEAEPEPPLEIELFGILDQLTEAERITVAVGLIHSLTTRAPELERTVVELRGELEKREHEIQRLIDIQQVEMQRLREELKNERANAMTIRQELESRRISVARTVEKIITVDSGKGAPTGGGHWGRAGGTPGPRVAMHRKPLTGHVPRVVREHLHNGSASKE